MKMQWKTSPRGTRLRKNVDQELTKIFSSSKGMSQLSNAVSDVHIQWILIRIIILLMKHVFQDFWAEIGIGEKGHFSRFSNFGEHLLTTCVAYMKDDIGNLKRMIRTAFPVNIAVTNPILTLGGRKHYFFAPTVGCWNNHLHLHLWKIDFVFTMVKLINLFWVFFLNFHSLLIGKWIL